MSVGMDIAGIGPAVSAAVAAKAKAVMLSTDGIAVSVVAGGNRGADKNALIAAVQAARKRSPWFIKKGSETWSALRFVAGGLTSSDYSVRKRAVDQIGKLMIEAIGLNVAAQRNQDGSAFAPLTAAYAGYKRRKFGFVAPILKATGDLLGGLRVRVDRLR